MNILSYKSTCIFNYKKNVPKCQFPFF